MDNLIRIRRKCKAGNVNVNGAIYTMDSYRDVMNKDILPLVDKKLLSSEIFFLGENPYSSFDAARFQTIYLPNSYCNKIVNISDEYIDVEITDESLLNLIRQSINKNKYSVDAQMRYYGEFDRYDFDVRLYKVTKIITFDIHIYGNYPYKDYNEYIMFNKEDK